MSIKKVESWKNYTHCPDCDRICVGEDHNTQCPSCCSSKRYLVVAREVKLYNSLYRFVAQDSNNSYIELKGSKRIIRKQNDYSISR